MTRVVVVGNGMVGSRFVEDLMSADTAGRFRVTVLGAEDCEPYNRVLLSEVIAGRCDLASLTLHTPGHERLTVHRGAPATVLDREDRVVICADGSRHRYDVVVLATGAAARIPPLKGLGGDSGSLPGGVHALRTIDDAREIVAATLNARRAVVLGAGVLGLEAACGLAARGVAVTVVHPAAALMERQLDGAASRAVESAMQRLGMSHRIGVGAEEAVITDGQLRGVRLSDGELIAAGLLVVSTGTTANAALAERSGLAVDRGILVGASLATDDPRVFAIGDCAQPPEGGSGLIAQGWDQARRLVKAMTGSQATPSDSPGDARGGDVVRLKAEGLDVVAMGVCGSARSTQPGERVVRLSDPAAGRHVEVVVAAGRLVGATCVGAGPVAADLAAAYTRGSPVPSDPAQLLLSPMGRSAAAQATSPALVSDDATVCRCNSVRKGEIVHTWQEGCRSVDEVAAATRATTGCGGCTDAVCALLDWLGDAHARPDAQRAVPAGAARLATSRDSGAAREDGFTRGKHTLHPREITAG